jgi:hypothetical protein
MAKCQEITVDRGKKIFVFDDVFEMAWRRTTFQFLLRSHFTIGWNDQEDPHNAQHLYLHSRYNEEDVAHMQILNKAFEVEEIKKLLEGKILDPRIGATVNLSMPTDTYFAHPHRNTTLLYYANPQWKEEWAGETLFFNEDVSEVVYTSIYKPGRVIIFDGGIPHSLRPQSRLAPQYRFTFALFFDSGVGLTESMKKE